VTASKLCTSCEKQPQECGTRCLSCYIKRRSAETPVPFVAPPMLRSRKWWQAHEEQFIAVLRGRVRAIQAGLEPGPSEELVDLFYHGTFTPWRIGRRRVDEVLRRIVSDVDDYARGNSGEQTGDDSGPVGG